MLEKILEEILEQLKEEGCIIDNDAGNRAEEIIRRHMNDGWISAKKKPEEDAFYVATMSGILVDQEEPFVGLAEFEDGEWVDGNDVIVWRPLPEPYRPEKE